MIKTRLINTRQPLNIQLGNNSVSVAQRFFIALVALERKQGFHLMGNKYNVNKIVTRQLKTFNIISIHGN